MTSTVTAGWFLRTETMLREGPRQVPIMRRPGNPTESTRAGNGMTGRTRTHHARPASVTRDRERSASRLIVRPPYGVRSSGRNGLLPI